MNNVRPLNKKVLVAENKVEHKTASGIILDGVESTRESRIGTVIAIGDEVKNVKVGVKILLDWSKAAIVKLQDVQRVLVNEEDIVAIVD